MNPSQRSEIVERVERRHQELLEQLDELNLQITQVLTGLTQDRENIIGASLQPDLSAS